MRGNKHRNNRASNTSPTTSITATTSFPLSTNGDPKNPHFLTVQRIHLLSNLTVQKHALEALIKGKSQYCQMVEGKAPLVQAEITILRRRLEVVNGRVRELEGELKGCVDLLRGRTGLRGEDEKIRGKDVAGGVGDNEMIEEKVIVAETAVDENIVADGMGLEFRDRIAHGKFVIKNRAILEAGRRGISGGTVTKSEKEGRRDKRESMTVYTNGVLSPKGSVWIGEWELEKYQGVAF